jgi:hypothetical protein
MQLGGQLDVERLNVSNYVRSVCESLNIRHRFAKNETMNVLKMVDLRQYGAQYARE